MQLLSFPVLFLFFLSVIACGRAEKAEIVKEEPVKKPVKKIKKAKK